MSHRTVWRSLAFVMLVAGGSHTANATPFLTFQGDRPNSSVQVTPGALGSVADEPSVSIPLSFASSFDAPLNTPVTENILRITLPSSILAGGTYNISETLAFQLPIGAPSVNHTASEAYIEALGVISADGIIWSAPLTSSYQDSAGDDYTITFNNAVKISEPADRPFDVTATFTYVPEPASLAVLGAGIGVLGLCLRRRNA